MEIVRGTLWTMRRKYGHGRVLSHVEKQDRPGNCEPGVRVTIADNGPGIPIDRFADLLQRGVRDDERREGQGLGLAIAQQLVDAYGGQIRLGTTTLGGAALEISFPPR